MFGKFERLLAWRYLRGKRREGFVSIISAFSVIGITLGVATLILVTSLMNGVREEMTGLFIGMDGHISIYGPYLPVEDGMDFAETVKQREGALAVFPKWEGQAMATNGGEATGVQILSIPEAAYAAKPLLDYKDGIQAGSGLLKRLRMQEGGTLTLITPQGRHTIAGFIPRMKRYTIDGSFELGMHAYDSSLILMPFDEALRYFQPTEITEPVVRQWEVILSNAEDAPEVAKKLQAELGAEFQVVDWKQRNATIFSALDVQRNVMAIILMLIVVVAAFNIISSLILLVQDKQADIAVLRTMGAGRGQIMRIFNLCGSAVGIAGTALGVGLGLVLAANLEAVRGFIESLTGQEILVENIYFLSHLPTRTDPLEVLLITLLSVGLSFAATLYPAWRATSIEPAEALRYG
jgi:lipoprotein-releasing system permease protein